MKKELTKEQMKSFFDAYSDPNDALYRILATKADNNPLWAMETIRFLTQCTDESLNNLINAASVSNERASYIEAFLEGKMYSNDEMAEKCKPLHIGHAQKIKEVTKKWR